VNDLLQVIDEEFKKRDKRKRRRRYETRLRWIMKVVFLLLLFRFFFPIRDTPLLIKSFYHTNTAGRHSLEVNLKKAYLPYIPSMTIRLIIVSEGNHNYTRAQSLLEGRLIWIQRNPQLRHTLNSYGYPYHVIVARYEWWPSWEFLWPVICFRSTVDGLYQVDTKRL
jgi:hypothetical protein